jgi:hypothetical protein
MKMAKGGGATYAGSGGGATYAGSGGRAGSYLASGKSGGSVSPIPYGPGQMPGGMPYQGMPDLFGISFMYGKDKYSLLVSRDGYVGLQTPKGVYIAGPDGQLKQIGKGGTIDNKVADAEGLYKETGAPQLAPIPYNQLEGQLKGPVTDALPLKKYDQAKSGGSAVPAGGGAKSTGSGNAGLEKKLTIADKYAQQSRDYQKQQSGSGQRILALPPGQLESMVNQPANSWAA